MKGLLSYQESFRRGVLHLDVAVGHGEGRAAVVVDDLGRLEEISVLAK